MENWCVHQWVKQWNTHVDWFAATVFASLFALLSVSYDLNWSAVAAVSTDFATLTTIYLGAVSMRNAAQSSRLLMLMLSLFIAAGIARFFQLLPPDGVQFLFSVGLVVTMVFLYKLSRRRCRQAWCVDFTDKEIDNACGVCGLNERRKCGSPMQEDRRRNPW
jgi:hypothetical protein